ncbi:M48 family metallopeptidase [Hoeflea sp. YIM 152468]|uniref:M48 family metallopeptidase n=1 Tax=Hoeflea sp. YIM 152468 TaxID=3031759 RepID=UPI0023DAB823|nr:M48 family metallopeptidase [Hoeflea sp. YIM 152468]MDF1610452.1 M48 family metallopeptidase [Hoeflea sp. YIM 152468]
MFGFGHISPTKKTSAPRPETISVNGRDLPLAIRENPRATRMTLRIEPGGQALKLTIPRGLPGHEVEAFLLRHHGWLMTRLARVEDGETLKQHGKIAIRGVEHRIEMTGKLRGLAEETEINGVPTLLISCLPEHIGRRVSDHLKRVAKRELEARVRIHAATLGKPVRGISYKDTKSRWGSCTSEGNLSFSWRIAMAPDFVIDYLAAHEVAHLKEMNHGPDFWATCKQLCPRTAEGKRWLKQNGSRLFAVSF